MDYTSLVDAILDGAVLDAAAAELILESPDSDLLSLVAAASSLRREHFGNRVKLNYLVSLKTGLCQENCGYCSQALGSTAPILKYSWLEPAEAVRQAEAGIAGGAARVCLVASGRGPMDRDVDRVAGIATELKALHADVEVCACMGLLKAGQAERLAAAGVDAYNHNINTAESFHDKIVTTHSYSDRVNTIAKAKDAGISTCSGLIVGMGESNTQIVEALFALRDLDSDSIPINFLVPFDGTPMQGRWDLTPAQCVRIVALARMVCPNKEVRLAGGREIHLRSLQGLALHVANSIFLGDYLTAEGDAAADDLALIRDNGFVIEGEQLATSEEEHQPRARRRGAGTTVLPNA